MRLQVFHRTQHTYASPVRESFNEVRLQPTNTETQRRHSFILKVLPPTRLTHYLDFNMNCVHMFEIAEPHTELIVEATSVVTTSEQLLPDDAPAAPFSSLVGCERLERCYDYLQPSYYVPLTSEVKAFAQNIGPDDVWLTALALMNKVYSDFEYRPASTTVQTTVVEALRLRHGVCQDFAHVLLGLCRARRIPARYVSGYLYNGPVDQLKGAQASHAWIEVYLPNHGWRGLDPTNNQQVNQRYVKVAVGRDYSDVSPMRGNYRGTAERRLHVEVLVTALDGEPAPLASAPA